MPDLQSMRTALRGCAWECLLVCVTLSAVASSRGGSFLTCFLCCQSILGVSDYLSSQALSSTHSEITPPLLLFHVLPPWVFLPHPCQPSFSSCCFSLSLSVFIFSFSSCQKGDIGVCGFFDLFILFFLKAFNWNTTGVRPYEIPSGPGFSFRL